jgi:putative Holliday junction resolvase
VKRVLGLDVGDRRIGVAVSDELGITVRGLRTIERTNIKADTNIIMEIASENNCSAIVIGLPLNLSGQDSVQTEKVRTFAQKLENKFTSNGIKDKKVELHDERYTTVIANRVMDKAGVKKTKQKKIIDQQAATIILEDWLRCNPVFSEQ